MTAVPEQRTGEQGPDLDSIAAATQSLGESPQIVPDERDDEYCGPEDLARAIRMSRHLSGASVTQADLSTDGLLHLVQRVYGVSLTTEEGRHPSFAVFVAAEGMDVAGGQMVRFEPPIEVTVRNLRRVAPAIPARGHALLVFQEDDELYMDGIMALDDANEVPPPGSALVSFGLGLPGLTLRVDRPGQIRGTENGLTWELRDGTIRPVYHYAALSVVQNWFHKLSLNLIDRMREESDDPHLISRQESLGDPSLIFDSVWSSILAAVVAGGHGGAFAILPDDGLDGLRIKSRSTGLDLSRSVEEFWSSCFDASEAAGYDALQDQAQTWGANRRRMVWSALQLGNLANVDGCVVLDRNLKLLGFGGEILVTAEDVADAYCTSADPVTLESRGEVDMQQFGTRHRSAFRLCAMRPGTLVFVISQDRVLRIFYGHRERPGEVSLWRSLGTGVASAYRL